jgi:flagellar hook-length control protein FliK
MLKEEHVRPIVNGLDFAGNMAGVLKQNKDEATKGLFEALFAQLSQNYLAEPVAATGTQVASTQSSYTTEPYKLPNAQENIQRPIQRLKASLEQTGQPLERFEVAAEDRDKLKESLVMSGYSEEDAQEIIERSSQDDGSVNMGVFFGVMEQYEPSEGPVFLLDAKDKPLLVQVLKELGLPDNEVREYVESLASKDGKLVVSGLPKMFARAMELQEVREGTTQVDQDTLKDLLAKIGLSTQDIKTLLTKATDTQGRISPEALMAVFEQAAAKQDQQVKSSLQQLAQNLRVVADNQEGQASDAERLKAQVMEILTKAEIQAKPQEKNEFSQNMREMLQANGQEDGKPDQEEIIRLVREHVATASSRSAANQSGGNGEGKADSQGQQAWAGLAEAKANAAQNAKAGAQGDASSKAAAAAASAEGGLNAATRVAAAQKTLPTYVMRQVSDQIAQMARNNQTQLRLALKPPELGELTIKLSLREGVLKATLLADSSSAKHTLEAGLSELKQQLAQQGLKLERMEVVVSPDAERREANGGEQGSGGNRQKGSSGGAAEVEMDDEEINPAMLGLDSGSGRVNVFA